MHTAYLKFTVFAITTILLGQYSIGRADEDTFRAHEWGTFTTLHFPNGQQQAWYQQPQLLDQAGKRVSDLPAFVRQSINGLKIFTKATARMETPVIYFYTKKPMLVDVSVSYPSGRFTEFFPGYPTGVNGLTPYVAYNGGIDSWTADTPVANNGWNSWNPASPPMNWTNLQLIPAGEAKDEKLPLDKLKPDNHYFAAREVPDAALVKAIVQTGDKEKRTKKEEVEKFLFYRGVGRFDPSLNPTINEQSEITVANQNHQYEVKHLWAVKNTNGEVAWQKLDSLPKCKHSNDPPTVKVSLKGLPKREQNSTEELEASMVLALVDTGLTDDEAKAMVNTWDTQWYDEPGQRVFSIVNPKLIDSILPLLISPKPDELIRVFVHRQEVLAPETLAKIETAMDPKTDTAETRKVIRNAELGRFVQGAVEGVAIQKGRQTTKEYLVHGMSAISNENKVGAVEKTLPWVAVVACLLIIGVRVRLRSV